MRAAGIAFEVVPGVTAAVAASAYAGIPVTHRDRASAVALVTAHEDPSKAESALDWEALAAFPGTLVFYMGVRQLEAIAARLIAGGRPADEPAAVVERGTLPEQRVVAGALGDDRPVAADGGGAGAGDNGGRRRRRPRSGSNWSRARAAAGRAARRADDRGHAGARPVERAGAGRLAELGAAVVEAPAIRIVGARGGAARRSTGFDLVCLTSPNGVRRSCSSGWPTAARTRGRWPGRRSRRSGRGRHGRWPSTGSRADVVPERFVAESLAASLEGHMVRAGADRPGGAGARRAAGRAAGARDRGRGGLALRHGGRAAGPGGARGGAGRRLHHVHIVLDRALLPRGRARSVRRRGSLSIGPVTSATLREHGLVPHVEAARHDIDGLVAAVVEDAAARKSGELTPRRAVPCGG